jgi:ubiquinone/menaquinone biosynthesis C-methylase UbiE
MSSTPTPPPTVLPARDGYDRWAAIYDDENNPLVALEEPLVSRLLGRLAGSHLLDHGCGTGRHALRCAAAEAHVTAVDFSSEMLARARAKPLADRVRWIQHDLTQPLPLPAVSFDRVVSGLVLEHIPALTPVFAEMRRVCRPDGLVVVSLMHPAMMLRGITARFTDPATGSETRPQSHPHQIADFLMAARDGGLCLESISEHSVDAALVARSPRAAKYLGWPLLLLLALRPE